MAQVVVLAEDRLPGELIAQALQGDGRLRMAAVIPDRGEEPPALPAADVLVRVVSRPAAALRWSGVALLGGMPTVVVDLAGHVGVEEALVIGAHGLLEPADGHDVLVERILAVAEAGSGYPSDVTDLLRVAMSEVAERETGFNRLTAAQQNLAIWTAAGMAVKEMARRLDISESAVRDRQRRIIKRLGLENSHQLAALVGRVTPLLPRAMVEIWER